MKILTSKIYFIVGIVFFVCGCKPISILHKDYFFITNTTNRVIVHEINLVDDYIGYKTYSILLDKACKDSLEWVISDIKGTSYRYQLINYGSYNIYNLLDTMSLTNEFFPNDRSIYFDKFNTTLNPFLLISQQQGVSFNSKVREDVSKIYLRVNDSLLSFMQKDTSMLTKFKDYYNK